MRDLDDLFNVYAKLETSHVFIVNIDREDEGAFYRTAAGISALHSVEITSMGIQGQIARAAKCKMWIWAR